MCEEIRSPALDGVARGNGRATKRFRRRAIFDAPVVKGGGDSTEELRWSRKIRDISMGNGIFRIFRFNDNGDMNKYQEDGIKKRQHVVTVHLTSYHSEIYATNIT